MPSKKPSGLPDLFQTPVVPGFVYKPDLVSPKDEARLAARFEALPFKPFDFHGHLGNRRIVSFGWRYDYGARRLQQAEPMPDFLMPLRETAAALSGSDAKAFEHALITEYAPGAGIGWHRDKPMFHHIVALSFLSPCRLRFRRRAAVGWDRRDIMVEPRSGYLLDGDARMVWEHSIPPVTRKRYSVTFRDLRSGSRYGTTDSRTQNDRAHGG